MPHSASLPVVTDRRRATYQDVLDAPPNMVAEVIDGQLVLMPRPAKPHAIAASVLGEELGPPFRRGRGGPGGWILLDEPELHVGEDILVPDLAGWRRERMPHVDDAAYFTLAPDWVCEVLSLRTAKIDRSDKLPIYAREQVAHAWLVDPLARTLEVLRREGSRWLLVGVWSDEARVRAEPFDAIELELGALWADVERRAVAQP
jgi:Uma2 family endonuclease